MDLRTARFVRGVVFVALGTVLFTGCALADDTESTRPASPAADANEIVVDGDDGGFGSSLRPKQLLVITGDELNTLAVFDPTTGEERVVPVPTELIGERPGRAIVGPDGKHVLVSVGDAAILWDRTADATVVLGYGERIHGVHPAVEPAVVLLRTNTAMLVVDLVRGGVYDVTEQVAGWPAGVVPWLLGDSAHRMALIAGPSGGAVAIDLESGLTTEHDDSLLFYSTGLAPDGATVVAGRRSEHGFAVEAFDPFDPSTSTVWHTPADPTAQVTVAWAGDDFVAVDLTGRLFALTDGEMVDIARVPPSGDDGFVTAKLHTDPTTPGVMLVEDRRSDPARWFHLDVTSGEIVELAELEGHQLLPTGTHGHVVVGRGDHREGFVSIRLVQFADGSVERLRDDEALPTLHVLGHPHSVIQAIDQDEHFQSSFYDSSGRLLGVIADASTLHLDAGAGVAAYAERERDLGDEVGFMTRVVALDGSSDESFTEMFPLAWLPIV